MEENIVKRVCEEFQLTQTELAKKLDVGTSAVSEWKKGKIPKMAQLALELMLENKEQQEKLRAVRDAFSIIQKIK